MNIKRAKQEIKDSIEAYLTKDNYGEYKNTIHQTASDPFDGPSRNWKKHRSWNRSQENVRLDW